MDVAMSCQGGGDNGCGNEQSIELDQFSRSPEVGGGAQGKAREGLADVISIHELLTNQILLPSSEVVVTRGDYVFAK